MKRSQRYTLGVGILAVALILISAFGRSYSTFAAAGYRLVNGIFAPGSGGTTLQSTHYRMAGTAGEPGLPNDGTTLASSNYRIQPGFLAAATESTPLAPTAVPTASPLRVYLPYIAVAPLVVNGGFEQGLSGWQVGGVMPVSVSTTVAHSGCCSALLGNPGYDCNSGVPIGEAYIAQTITVPNAADPTLSFAYRMFTQDALTDKNGVLYDSFDVYANASDTGPLLFRGGNTDQARTGCSSAPLDLGWRVVAVSLNGYQGKTITLYFANENRIDGYDNTYTYLDDVALSD